MSLDCGYLESVGVYANKICSGAQLTGGNRMDSILSLPVFKRQSRIVHSFPPSLGFEGGDSRQPAHTPVQFELFRQRSGPIALLQVGSSADAPHDSLQQ